MPIDNQKQSLYKQEDKLLQLLKKIPDEQIRDDILHLVHTETMEHPQAYIHILDKTGKVLFVNKSMQDLMIEEVIGRSFASPKWELSEELMGKFRAIFAEALKGKTITERVVFPAKKNRYKIFNLFVKPVFKQGRVMYLLGISYEITPQEEIEELKKTKQLYEKQVKDSFVIRVSFPGGRCEYVSPSFKNVTGWELKEGGDAYSYFLSKVHPDFMKEREEYRRMASKGNVPPITIFRAKHKIKGYRWFHQTNSPVHDSAGNLIAIECVVRDITDQKNIEDRFNNMKEKFTLILKEGKVAIGTTTYGKESKSIFAESKAFFSESIKNITGYEAKDFIDDPERWIKIIHADDFSSMMDTYSRQLDKEDEVNLVFRCMRKDGFVSKIKVWGKIFRDNEGKPVRSECIFMDVSDKDVYDELLDYFARKIAEDEIEKKKAEERYYIR